MFEKNINVISTIMILVSIVLLVLLYSLSIFTLNTLILGASIILTTLYAKFDEKIFLTGGVIGFCLSIINIINRRIPTDIDMRFFIIFLILGIVSGYIFMKKGRQAKFFLFSGVFFSLGIYDILERVLNKSLLWLPFLSIALVFYLAYQISYIKNGVVWPKYISYLLFGIGIIISVFYISILNKLSIKIIVPISIALIGLLMFRRNMANRRKDDE